jgi:hypothetical protein
MATTNEELMQRHAHHAPSDDKTVDAHEWVRNATGRLAVALNERLPEGREKSIALTHLQEVMMFANAAIAIEAAKADG